MEKIYKIIVTTLCMVSFLGCKPDTNTLITKYIEKNCSFTVQNDSCVIDIRNVFNIEWDTMYIFPSWSMEEDISSALGIHYQGSYVKDDTKRIIFVKDKKVVSEDDYYESGQNTIEFEYTNWPDQRIKYSTPMFTVKRMQEKDGFLYKLTPICYSR